MSGGEAGAGLERLRTEGLLATVALYWEDGERLRAALGRAEDDLREARAEVDALHASTSWRLTAPLRALSRRLPRRG